ncbi:hypothetical protein KFK09_001307 [Dendrobium nobile]|uniref:Tf2-1-like SH3-like domain-containing protein n=1 Tax=Dendrobium nobile TaxID=94219 RepID=A0A8T3CAH3_DENNO|nr:hypothetical protein KFK09_001307 [Dendrobium nobile]
MPNRSTSRCPFSIVYTKMPNTILSIAIFPKCKRKAASEQDDQFTNLLSNIWLKLQASNNQCKIVAAAHRWDKLFNLGNLVYVRLYKECLLAGSYSKLSKWKWGPFPINKKLNNNVYVVDLPTKFNALHTFNVVDIYAYEPRVDSALHLESSSLDHHGGGI